MAFQIFLKKSTEEKIKLCLDSALVSQELLNIPGVSWNFLTGELNSNMALANLLNSKLYVYLLFSSELFIHNLKQNKG